MFYLFKLSFSNYFVITIVALILLTISSIIFFGVIFPSYNPPQNKNYADQFVEVYNSKIRFRITEREKPTVIFLHSFGSSLETWNELKKYFDCGRIITLDIIGFGASDKPKIDYDLGTHQKYLLAFMDALNIDKAILIGVSMGASIAAWITANAPDRISGCVLFAPSGYPGSMWHKWPNRLFYRKNNLNRIARVFIKNKLFETLFPLSLARQALGVTSTYDEFFAQAITKIKRPSLIFWSPGDKRVDFNYSRFYLQSIPKSKLIRQPDHVGHDIATYQPEKTAQKICNFLSTINSH